MIYSVSYTTRASRKGERDGVAYHFHHAPFIGRIAKPVGIPSIYISKDRTRKGPEWIETGMALAEPLEAPVVTVAPSRLTAMADTDTHQGILLRQDRSLRKMRLFKRIFRFFLS